MPTGMGLLRQQRGPLARSFMLIGSGGATREIETTGKVCAVWAFRLCTSSATVSTARLENQAGVDMWNLNVPAVSGSEAVTEFDPPLISYDGLQVVTAGAASQDVMVCYSLIEQL